LFSLPRNSAAAFHGGALSAELFHASRRRVFPPVGFSHLFVSFPFSGCCTAGKGEFFLFRFLRPAFAKSPVFQQSFSSGINGETGQTETAKGVN
jgi:hypothetical protein